MNDFYKDKLPNKTYIIDINSSQNSAEKLENMINKDFPPKEQSQEFNIVYIYSLQNKKFNYPNNESNVLYIGHTKGEIYKYKKDLGFRFKHCLSIKDNKRNICLSNYYSEGYILELDLFEVENCKKIETNLRYKFLKIYGALPIADGASYKKEKLAEISDIIEGK